MGGHEMVLQMVAWQDPQAIAIKAFYEPDLHVNFCAKLATDPVVQVVPCALCTGHAVKCAAKDVACCHCRQGFGQSPLSWTPHFQWENLLM